MLGESLQQIRKQSGLSQKDLASRADTFQANLSEIENGIVNPSLHTAEQLFSILGYRLVPVPLKSLTIQEWGSRINEATSEGRERRAFRIFLQINEELSNLEPEILQVAVAVQPNIQDPKYSALISGLVEWHLKKSKLAIPAWVKSNGKKLKSAWFVDEIAPNKSLIKQKTPSSFSKRNIYISETELRSV
jgi:transcriptional regulator with XRE-family HTH domain